VGEEMKGSGRSRELDVFLEVDLRDIRMVIVQGSHFKGPSIFGVFAPKERKGVVG
jgi:hypothetical protein